MRLNRVQKRLMRPPLGKQRERLAPQKKKDAQGLLQSVFSSLRESHPTIRFLLFSRLCLLVLAFAIRRKLQQRSIVLFQTVSSPPPFEGKTLCRFLRETVREIFVLRLKDAEAAACVRKQLFALFGKGISLMSPGRISFSALRIGF